MRKSYTSGFSILEFMIIITIAATLVKLAIGSYQSYTLDVNRGLAKQTMLQNLSLMEKFYAENGQYIESSTTWPNMVVSVVGVNGRPVYSISFYPSQATSANRQAYCMLAVPVSGSVQDGQQQIYVDRFGNFSSTAPTNCSISSNNNSICSNNSVSYFPCSGNCSTGIYSACSGNCDNVTVCAGGSGCSGNCRNSVIYGPCSGNCINSVIYWNGTCGGNCRRSTCCNVATGVCKACP